MPIVIVTVVPNIHLRSFISPRRLVSRRSILFPMPFISCLVARFSSLAANAWLRASAWALGLLFGDSGIAEVLDVGLGLECDSGRQVASELMAA